MKWNRNVKPTAMYTNFSKPFRQSYSETEQYHSNYMTDIIRRTIWANGMNFVINHATGVRSIARRVAQQSSALPLYHGRPLVDKAKCRIELALKLQLARKTSWICM